MSQLFSTKAGVILSPLLRRQVAKTASRFCEATGKQITVTDGLRTPQDQAFELLEILKLDPDLSVYRNRAAALEISREYLRSVAEGLDHQEIVARLNEIITRQMSQGVFISAHLTSLAVDVRCRDMSPTERTIFREIASQTATKVLLESHPPHFHLEFAESS